MAQSDFVFVHYFSRQKSLVLILLHSNLSDFQRKLNSACVKKFVIGSEHHSKEEMTQTPNSRLHAALKKTR